MNKSPDKANAKQISDCHELLTELQLATCNRINKERYECLFCQLSKIMFSDFYDNCDSLVRRLTSNNYYVNIDETEDVLQEVLLKISQKVATYRGKNDSQARSWICQIIRRTVLDASKTTSRRGEIWEHLNGWIRPLWVRYGDNNRSEE